MHFSIYQFISSCIRIYLSYRISQSKHSLLIITLSKSPLNPKLIKIEDLPLVKEISSIGTFLDEIGSQTLAGANKRRWVRNLLLFSHCLTRLMRCIIEIVSLPWHSAYALLDSSSQNAEFSWKTIPGKEPSKWGHLYQTGFISKISIAPAGTATQVHIISGCLFFLISEHDHIVSGWDKGFNIEKSEWEAMMVEAGGSV